MRAILFIAVLLPVWVFSQSTITGIVSDAYSGEKLPDVYIYIPDLQKGTVSSLDGKYTISNLPDGIFKVQYSFLGYETQVITVQLEGNSVIKNISMHSASVHTQEVIVSGGQAGSQHENAIKIETVKKDILDNGGNGNIMKRLNVIPGVDAISKGNTIATPVIRGLSTSNIVVLNNGTRMENFQFSEDHPYTIDESDVESIEVIKGPASLLYGSDAVGGVINFVKASPAPINTTKVKVQTVYNTNDNSTLNAFNLKSSGNNLFGGVSGSYNSAKDYSQGDVSKEPERVANSRNTTYSAKAFGGFRNTKAIYKIYYDYNKMILGITNPPAIQLVTDNERANSAWYQDLDNHMLLSRNTWFFNHLKIDFDVSYQHNHRKLQGNPDTDPFTLVDMKLNTVTWQAKGRYDFSEHNNFIAVIQGVAQDNNNGNAPDHILPDFNTLSNSIAGLWQYNTDEKAFYQLGVRYDFKQIASPTQLKDGIAGDTLTSFNGNFGNVSFSAGMTYKLLPHLLLRTNIASAYRTPTVAELLQDGVHGNRYEQGNRDFSAQRNVEGDVSLHFHGENIMLDFSTFYNRIFNYIYLAPTADTTSDGLDIYRYMQDDAMLYGAEFSGEYHFIKMVKLKVTYAHVTAHKDDGSNLPFIPQDKIHLYLTATKKLANTVKKVEGGIDPLIALSQNSPYIFETKTDGYFLLNCFISTDLRINNIALQAGIYASNILNTAYFDHLSTLKPLGIYNQGRNISFKLEMVF